MQKYNIYFSFAAFVIAAAVSGCTATGGINGTGSGATANPEPEVFRSHFSRTTKFGNYDVNNPRQAEGQPDDQYAVVETHGSLTLDVGSGLSFYNGSGTDVYIDMHPDKEVNYTVHVSHATAGDREWIEVGRGYGSEEFDFHTHTDGPEDYIQIRNEGPDPLYIDAAEARYVRRD